MPNLNVNGKVHEFDAEPDTPLLWVLREQLGLTGTKYGCGVAQCGACTVHIDGVADAQLRAAGVVGRRGREDRDDRRACPPTARTRCRRRGSRSTCRSAATASRGMIMAAAALLKTTPNPTDADIDAAMTNICRCGTYNRVRAAIKAAAAADVKAAGLAHRARRRERRHERVTTRVSRRRFLGASAALRRRPRRRLPHSVRRRRGRAGTPPTRRDQRLGRRPARRHRHHPHRALRDGPGHADRPRAARRRGARVRLGEGPHRVPDARARTSRATASGATSRPAAAAASAIRRSTCARAAPRRAMMLVQAAADEWKVPAAECVAAKSVDHAHAVGPHDDATARSPPRRRS